MCQDSFGSSHFESETQAIVSPAVNHRKKTSAFKSDDPLDADNEIIYEQAKALLFALASSIINGVGIYFYAGVTERYGI